MFEHKYENRTYPIRNVVLDQASDDTVVKIAYFPCMILLLLVALTAVI